jgi:response regulator RpfG family c-di-GMP phosphodiesterase
MNPIAKPAGDENKRPRILFVDDEPLLLEGLRRALHKEFDAELAGGGAEGLEKIKKSGPYPVVVSDMRMPGMDGAEFLSQVRAAAPESIRVMLTGYADMEAAMRAVNEGRIFRFLNKPVSPDDLALALRACLTQFELARREKELLENTLAGAVRVLTEVLNLANPAAFNKGTRIQQFVSHIAAKLGFADIWQYEIAALLSELGCITLTPDLVEAVHADQPLSPEDQQRYRKHPKIGHDLLARIPRLELVAEMILQQEDSAPSFRPLPTPAEQTIHNGAQMLKVSLAFDRLMNGGSTKAEAIQSLGKAPVEYERAFVAALEDYQVARQPTELRAIDVRDLRTGMVLREDLRATSGILLAAKGQEVSHALVKTVRNFVDNGSVKGTVRVVVGVGETWIAKSAAR